jgi:hypothetical protein
MEMNNEQKPVAWMVRDGVVDYQLVKRKEQADHLVAELQKRHDLSGALAAFNAVALYAHPVPTRQPLTDKQIDELKLPESGTGTIRDLVRIVERAHGIGGVK